MLSDLCSLTAGDCYNSRLCWKHFPILWDLNLSGFLHHTKMLCSVLACFQDSQPARDRPDVSLIPLNGNTNKQAKYIFNKTTCCWSLCSVLLYQEFKNAKCHICPLHHGVSLFCTSTPPHFITPDYIGGNMIQYVISLYCLTFKSTCMCIMCYIMRKEIS